MTDAECAAILAEFRGLTLGPELSAALDHAIGRLSAIDMQWASIDPAHPAHPMPSAADRIKAYGGIPMGSRAIDLAMA